MMYKAKATVINSYLKEFFSLVRVGVDTSKSLVLEMKCGCHVSYAKHIV